MTRAMDGKRGLAAGSGVGDRARACAPVTARADARWAPAALRWSQETLQRGGASGEPASLLGSLRNHIRAETNQMQALQCTYHCARAQQEDVSMVRAQGRCSQAACSKHELTFNEEHAWAGTQEAVVKVADSAMQLA